MGNANEGGVRAGRSAQIEEGDILAIKRFASFSEEDAAALKALLPIVTRHIDQVVDMVVARIKLQPGLLDAVCRSEGGAEQIREYQKQCVLQCFQGDYGPAYFNDRLRCGEVHHRLGMPPYWYVACFGAYVEAVTPLILAHYPFNWRQRERALQAFNRIASIDLQLAVRSFQRTGLEEKFADYQGQIEAISMSQAVIEFNLDGIILTANANALGMFGYSLDEICGRHHRALVDSEYSGSTDYRIFWERLNRGEFDAGEYRLTAKGGKDVWSQATYNPILDSHGKPFKVVMYANDITSQKTQNTVYQSRVKSYSAFIDEVAHGNLRQRVNAVGTDELSLIGGNLNAMTESLARMAGEVGEASNEIFSTLSQLQVAVEAQSNGASEQAAAVNETTVTLEEIMATSVQTLSKAQHLGESAERTRREGEQGLLTVKETVRGMEAIRARVENIAHTILALSEQTQQIGEITAVVTNLAQQSKMLAFNASIEAAKAGDAGRGFAVVAAEVKDLAEQSQQSTAQVQKILQDIRRATDRAVMATEEGSKGVDAGVLLVQKSGEVMKQLSEVIHETALGSQQIVAAVRQEVTGIKQVTTAMSEINKVTTQFVAGTHEVKRASTRLGDVAGKLRDSVSVYKI
ncbi:methyl-accepting chemotaxis sensory transducer with Pas/Pac sensor [Fluviicoccus keumensis]|uniref:Methyl-accepting chemotaxis sensory transducer with Pas/Pac sensor n=1 Tax=Fluviicoccus keumensis TaxID=1435465 RepID=A0A4Q7ZC32_9GAMM|nr:methyl-accepting chemotaxis protein [Fluviicoccus keumensis]RZU47734.1 methyl-accepting chemotaxis sensory transducer with Pas/Pac sensor [Fluviicoccus keumensis]